MSEAQRALTVEFLGLPGVGKTAVASRTAAQLSRQGLVAREPVRAISNRSGLGPSLRGYAGKSCLIARELLAHPLQSLRSIRAIHSTGQPSLSVLIMVVTNWLVHCSLLRTSRATAGIHLLEEGIFQALWSIGLEGRPGAIRDLGGALIASLPLPDLVAVVEADLATVVKRLGKRHGRDSRADDWSREDEQAFTHAAWLMLEVVDVLSRASGRRRGPHLIRVENRAGIALDLTAAQLALQLEQAWNASLRPAHPHASARTTA